MRIFARNCLIALVDTCQVPVKTCGRFRSCQGGGGFISKFAIYMYFKDLRRIITIKMSIKLFYFNYCLVIIHSPSRHDGFWFLNKMHNS